MNRTQLYIGAILTLVLAVVLVAVFHVDIPVIVAIAAIALLGASFFLERQRRLPPRIRDMKPEKAGTYRPSPLALRTTEP